MPLATKVVALWALSWVVCNCLFLPWLLNFDKDWGERVHLTWRAHLVLMTAGLLPFLIPLLAAADWLWQARKSEWEKNLDYQARQYRKAHPWEYR